MSQSLWCSLLTKQGSFFSCLEQLEALEMCHDMESLSLTVIKTQPRDRLEGWCSLCLYSELVGHQAAQPEDAVGEAQPE